MKDRIYQLMKKQNMTQKEFANELCIAEGTLSSIFSGRTKPSNNIVYSIHERFPEVSISWLMFGEGEMDKVEVPSNSQVIQSTPTPSVIPTTPDLFQNTNLQQNPVKEIIQYIEKPQRQITEIRVFFDDGTYQTFSC